MRHIALIDGNNFFVSCERLFRPDLADKPVIVLSSNDGCAIARSNEAKELGIKMGQPWFQIRNDPKYREVVPFSSNFALYADMSNRFMNVLSTFSPVHEVYSIDECFLDLTGFSDIRERAFSIKETVLKYLGLPVCVGIGSTKTLAKLANHVAKKHPRSPGVFNFNALDEHQQNNVLGAIEVEEVWGIGSRLSVQLRQHGIQSARDLSQADAKSMRRRFGVTVERVISELRGESCIAIEEVTPPRQQMMMSRTFSQALTTLEDLQNAVAFFAGSLARKLRSQGSASSLLQVFIMTDRFAKNTAQHSPSRCIPFSAPTSDTILITRMALQALEACYQAGFSYRRAGVCLSEISSADICQMELFPEQSEDRLASVMDTINDRFGAGALRLSHNDPHTRNWSPQRELMSPRYTTHFAELPVCS